MKKINLIDKTAWIMTGFLPVLSATFLALFLAGCSPKIYIIDNQTVLEEEAAGSWPQFEKQILDRAKAKGPTPLSQVPPNKTRTRLYNVLNGEMPIVVTSATGAAQGSSASAYGAADSEKRLAPKAAR